MSSSRFSLIACAVCFIVIARPTQAQAGASTAVRGGYSAQPAEVKQYLLNRAFAKIPLTAAQKDSALALITRQLAENATIDWAGTDAFLKRDAIVDRRNEALRALLPSEKDRATFDINIDLLYPGRSHAALRPE